MSRYVKEACEAIGVIGEGVREHFTAHGLRTKCTFFLFRAGHQNEIFSRKYGHSHPRSLKAYHKKDGVIGKILRADMFGENVMHIEICEDTSRKKCDDRHEDKWLPPSKKVRIGIESDGSNCVPGGNQERKLDGSLGNISEKSDGGKRTDVTANMGSTQHIEKPSTVNHTGIDSNWK